MTPKRQRKGTKAEANQAKRRKYEDASSHIDEMVNDAIKPTKITDINNDCLQHIFNYLSVVDLLSVCDASKRLYEAVELSFKSRHYDRVQLVDIAPSTNQLIVVDTVKVVTISHLTTCLKYLRNFGHTIEMLTINYNGIAENHCAEVDRHVSKYCGDTLEAVHIHHAQPYSMNNIKKFSEVLIVKFYNCELSHQLTNFENWFPKMWSLEYNGINKVTDADSKCFSKRIPNLEHLSIELATKGEDVMQIGILKLAEILRSNPQILYLTINGSGLDAKGLQSISEDLRNVECLYLFLTRHFSNLKSRIVKLKHITSLFVYFDYSVPVFPKIPLSCQRLKELSISAMNELNAKVINFIVKQKSLKILNLSRCEDSTFKNIINDVSFEKVLRSLEALSLGCEFSTDEVIIFLHKYSTMKKFDFILDKNSNLDCLIKRLPAGWRIGNFCERSISLEFNNRAS